MDQENDALDPIERGAASESSLANQFGDDAAERLLTQAEADLAAALDPGLGGHLGGDMDLSEASPFKLEAFGNSPDILEDESERLEALQDVELDVRIELGRTELLIDDVLRLKEGSVVPLDKLAGDPVDILVNGRLIARGEVLVLNDNFCVRVAEILTPDF
jgi:flagellar motor switch protein FliN/FliY